MVLYDSLNVSWLSCFVSAEGAQHPFKKLNLQIQCSSEKSGEIGWVTIQISNKIMKKKQTPNISATFQPESVRLLRQQED